MVLSREESRVARTSKDELIITTFVFNVRNIPAALYKAMGGFATNGINMTKLESYQLGGKFVATQFYADIEGIPTIQACAMRWTSCASSRKMCASSAPIRRIRCAACSEHAVRLRPTRFTPDARENGKTR